MGEGFLGFPWLLKQIKWLPKQIVRGEKPVEAGQGYVNQNRVWEATGSRTGVWESKRLPRVGPASQIYMVASLFCMGISDPPNHFPDVRYRLYLISISKYISDIG